MSRRAMMLFGVVLFAVGGALLAFGGDPIGAPVGTVFALAGGGLLAWALFRREGGGVTFDREGTAARSSA